MEVKMGKLSLLSLFLIISFNGFFAPEAMGVGKNPRPPVGVGSVESLSKEELNAITRYLENQVLRRVQSSPFNISLDGIRGAFLRLVESYKVFAEGKTHDFRHAPQRPGVFQEIYLSILTRLARGEGPPGTFLQLQIPGSPQIVFILKEMPDELALQLLNLNMDIEDFKEVRRKTPEMRSWDLGLDYQGAGEGGGAQAFIELLNQAPLDAGGIVRLKAFLSGYKGVVDEEGLFKKMMAAVENKRPASFTYLDYDYKSVYREGDPSFPYKAFDIDPLKVERLAKKALAFAGTPKARAAKPTASLVDAVVKRERTRIKQILDGGGTDSISKASLRAIRTAVKAHVDLSRYRRNHPVRRLGIIQEFYLRALTDTLRGEGNLPRLPGEERIKDYLFLEVLDEASLDKRGLSLLKAHLLAYEGVSEENREILDRLLKAIDRKRPVVPYNRYKYEAVYRGGAKFPHQKFNFDLDKKEVVTLKEMEARRISDFAELIQNKIKGNTKLIERVAVLVKENAVNPEKFLTLTLLGTTGNGKTEFAYALAETLFGEREAAGVITFSGNEGELNSYLRSEVGYVGSNEPTDFEKWVEGRVKNGQGGVIVLDELLSLDGLTERQISQRHQSLSRLYDLLETRKLKIGAKVFDVSKFHVVITGNMFQELFFGLDDTPDSEKIVENIISKLKNAEIVRRFTKVGIDPPKLGRLGEIFINGPLKKLIAYQVARSLLEKRVKKLNALYKELSIVVPDEVLIEIVDRMSTVELGMREVRKGIDQVVMGPVSGIYSTGKDSNSPRARRRETPPMDLSKRLRPSS